MEIDIKGMKIPYTITRRSHQKTIRLRISSGGVVSVSTRKNVSDEVISDFVRRQATWIYSWFSKRNILPKTRVERGNVVSNEYRVYKEKAKDIALKKVTYWNSIYGFVYKKISIRKSETRWGSCSRKGNLQFSYKIALLPDDLADYLVVHELCHLCEFNHSDRFWKLVSKTIPDYVDRRKKLKGIF
ncbi:MAG: M48 family metallopeptidase [Candidatus Taylorbacteria bacterium]|nr:M48 family metallopeptidase [Candidatus Taylorbacteria bacterium]